MFDAKDAMSLSGAGCSAPYLSAEIGPIEMEYLRLEIEAAGKERDALKRYDEAQKALFDEARKNMMAALRRECARAAEANERADEAETKAQFCRATALSERHMRVLLMWWAGGYAAAVTVLAGWAWMRIWGWLQ